MFKLTKDEYWLEEKALELVQSKMAEIESKLAKIEGGEYDADPGEIEAIKVQLEDQYKRLEAKADKSASFLRHSFVSEPWEDNPDFDYQLTEMKA